MSADFLDLGDRIELFNSVRLDEEAVRRWEDEQREPSPLHASDAVEAIGSVLRFIADGLTVGNMPERSIALLVLLRPDLVNGCDYRDLAAEIGSDEARIAKAVSALRDEFPALRGGYALGRKSDTRRVLHGRWRRERIEARERSAEIEARRERQRMKALEDMRELDRRWGLA